MHGDLWSISSQQYRLLLHSHCSLEYWEKREHDFHSFFSSEELLHWNNLFELGSWFQWCCPTFNVIYHDETMFDAITSNAHMIWIRLMSKLCAAHSWAEYSKLHLASWMSLLSEATNYYMLMLYPLITSLNAYNFLSAWTLWTYTNNFSSFYCD